MIALQCHSKEAVAVSEDREERVVLPAGTIRGVLRLLHNKR